MESKKLAGAVSAATLMFSFGALAPASAADGQVFGLQQTVTDPSGEIGYTVTKFLPSGDAVPFPVTGQLYEVTVRADALNGMPTPAVPAFSAHSESGQSYPALAGAWTPQGLGNAPLLPGGQSTGKVYFDAVGEAPTSVVYNGPGDMLTWIEPPAAASEEERPPPKRRLPKRLLRKRRPPKAEAAPRTPRPTATSQRRKRKADKPFIRTRRGRRRGSCLSRSIGTPRLRVAASRSSHPGRSSRRAVDMARRAAPPAGLSRRRSMRRYEFITDPHSCNQAVYASAPDALT